MTVEEVSEAKSNSSSQMQNCLCALNGGTPVLSPPPTTQHGKQKCSFLYSIQGLGA